jgi:hypothetical protein
MQWQCERPFVVCAPYPQWCPSRFSRPQRATTQHSAVRHPCVASGEWLEYAVPEHARSRATVIVVVPALLAQVLLPVSRQSPFPPWVFVARALLLLLPLLLVFGLSVSTSRTISTMSESSVPSKPPSSSAGGRARLARPLVLAPAPAFFFAFEDRVRTLRQFSQRQESSLLSAFVESARNRARFASV